jgi:hypothetical protein
MRGGRSGRVPIAIVRLSFLSTDDGRWTRLQRLSDCADAKLSHFGTAADNNQTSHAY